MSDDNNSPVAPTRASATTTGRQAPSGFTSLRRSATVDENSSRRRSRFDSPSVAAATANDPFEGSRRRSSTFSEYSLGEATGLFNPKPAGAKPSEESSNWASVPLAFALLPAVGGVFFKNGSAVVTDIMLLGLAAIFLHWSVTQPWNWYHCAQEVRVREELQQSAIETDEESETDHHSVRESSLERDSAHPQDETPEQPSPRRTSGRKGAASDALAELYLHEILALSSCFLFPIVSAYLLHTLRSQLSRPSEGLVSNYNLTIFLLASELRPLSHLMTLVQSRTLHLQRIVNENPFQPESNTQLSELAERLEALEAGHTPRSPSSHRNGTPEGLSNKQEATLVRDVRNVIQPELDALNRAVRRYEKKATLLSLQTEARFNGMDTRLNDAISLAAAAAKHSNAQPGLIQWLAESIVDLIMLPFKGLFSLMLFPFRTALGLLQRKKLPERRSRSGRNMRSSASYRSGSDRQPTRVSRR